MITGAQTTSASNEGNTTLEIIANVGITIIDNDIDFGQGYVSSTSDYAIIDTHEGYTNWLNSTGGTGFTTDFHTIENTGSTASKFHVEVADESVENAEYWLCGGGTNCPSEVAIVKVKSLENELGSCTGSLIDEYETLLDHINRVASITLCDNFNPVDSMDTLNVYYYIAIPQEAPTGLKQLQILYSAEETA